MAVTLIAAGITYVLQVTSASVYRAETTVLITKTDAEGFEAGSSRFMAPRLSVDTYVTLLDAGVVVSGDGDPRAGTENTIDVSLEDAPQSAILRIGVRASTPTSAQRRADAAANALIDWDLARARRDATERIEALQRQVDALEAELDTVGGVRAARLGATLEARRSDLETLRAATSTSAAATPLSVVREAPLPERPAAPRPVRNTVLVGLMAGLSSVGVILAVRALRRP